MGNEEQQGIHVELSALQKVVVAVAGTLIAAFSIGAYTSILGLRDTSRDMASEVRHLGQRMDGIAASSYPRAEAVAANALLAQRLDVVEREMDRVRREREREAPPARRR